MANYWANTLTIAIPALNEEEAIGHTISRCLEARNEIEQAANLESVEIIVVSDGSTDRTVEIAQSFEDVKVIIFEQNRGYGAAIKEGFRHGTGSLVGFLDADGTCDPRYFADMCRAAIEYNADVILGSRLGPESKMSFVRKIGNRLYATTLGLLSGQAVSDTASGMRVIRRASLDLLYPLPDGMHFTPAMSARALLNGLRVVEIPMRYEERIGRSKLSVLHDGVRFLRAIIDGVLCYRPERIFLMGFTLCLLFAILLAAYPIEHYWQNARIEEWMVYRFVVCFLLGSAGFLSLNAAALAHCMTALGPRRRDSGTYWAAAAAYLFSGKRLAVLAGMAVACSLALLWPGIIEYLSKGQVTLHWSRIFVGAFGFLLAFQAVVTGILLQVLEIWENQRKIPHPTLQNKPQTWLQEKDEILTHPL
jgi:glycosyltransferase involved in cell wall biosynthesis